MLVNIVLNLDVDMYMKTKRVNLENFVQEAW